MECREYTAQEMRTRANTMESIGHSVVATMLRQAADMMERVEKREKKCVDDVRWIDGEHVLVSKEEWHEYQEKQA